MNEKLCVCVSAFWNTVAGHLAVGVPPTGKPMAAMRKARSVEELDQPRARGDGRHGQARARKTSYGGSEVSSLWNVTPPGSVAELDEDSVSKKSTGRVRKVAKSRKENEPEKAADLDGRAATKRGKKAQPPAPPPKTKSKTSKSAAAAVADRQLSNGNESEEYFLDDDDDDASSVDDLDVEVRTSGRGKKSGGKRHPEPASSKSGKTKRGGKRKGTKEEAAGMQTWIDDQAQMLKERDRSEAVNPVAHSTPPVKARHRRRKETSSSGSDSSTGSESGDSSSETTSDTDAPKGPPPPPPPSKSSAGGKPKPPPPPKPSKGSRSAMGVSNWLIICSKKRISLKRNQT